VSTCRACGQPIPEGARFCPSCGTPVSATAPEERRLVTVLFCDLVGFTELSDQADPEDVRATLRAFHEPLKEVVELYGGTIDKFIGDAVLGVFGAPIAHEDDPIRAVLAAIRVQDTIARRSESLPHPLSVRIGIDSGEAVVAFGSGPQVGESVAGDVVNTASRLQSVAPVNGTVVGEATYLATRHLIRYEELGPVSVKGKGELLRIWRPVEAFARTGIDPRGPATPFVGRADELAQLRTIFRRVLPAATAHDDDEEALRFVTISGEPGIGKTRLITTFADYVDELPDLVRWRQGRCLPYGEGVSFWALGEVVKSEAGVLDDDAPEIALEKLDAALASTVADEEERDWLRPRLAPLLGLGDPTREMPREDLFAAWRRFLEALAHDTAFVLIFEDLHWADAAFLDFIDELVRGSRRSPIMLLCATRPELFDRRPDWGRGIPNAAQIVLPPLTDGETAGLIGGLLDRVVLPSETQAMLIDRSGGNPLFAEEFVRMLADHGILEGAGSGRLTDPTAAIPVPDSLQSLIGARLDALPPALKSLLHDAAVIGRVFWSGAVARVSGIAEEEVRSLLDLAARRELVRGAPSSSVTGQTEHLFWHALIRDVAYGQIPRSARGRKHVEAARWIQDTVGERAADFAEEIAYHYIEAIELASTGGGAVPADVRSDAATALVLAGERARNLSASRASEYFDRALDLMTAEHPDRPRASLRAAEVASMTGSFPEAEQLYLAAMVAARAQRDMHALGDAMGMLSRHYSRIGDTARAKDLMRQALEILEAEPPGPELARAYNRLAGERLVADDFAGTLEVAERSLELSRRLAMDDEIVQALQNRGAARCELGDEGGLDDLREAVRLGRARGLAEETAASYGNLSYQIWFREGPAKALETWRQMEELADRHGYVTQVQWSRMGQLETLFDLGEWDRVLDLARVMEAWDLPLERHSQVGVYAHLFEAWVRLRRGQDGGLDDVVDGLLVDARRIGLPEYLAPALILALEVRRLRGDTEGSRAALAAFAELTTTAPAYRSFLLPVVVRALVAMGRVDTAEEMMPPASEVRTWRHRLSYATARAAILEARGDLEAAADGYAEAAGGWRAYGFTLEEGLTHLGAARCLRGLGRPDRAAEAAARAREVLVGLGAAPSLAEADELAGPIAGSA
jgi:class 3 adenylate cyclase/tetratricopeptide (TPR) repeat protein